MQTTPDTPTLTAPVLVGSSDGGLGVPAGEYLVHVWSDGTAELAWREPSGLSRRTWSPPVRLEVAP